MNILLWILAILIGVPLILTLIPVRYRVTATVGEGTTVHATASYLLRLIHITFVYDQHGLDTSLRIAGCKLKARPSAETAEAKPAPPKPAPRKVKPTAKVKPAPAPPREKGMKERFEEIKALLTRKDLKIIIGILYRYIKKTFRYLLPGRFAVSGVVGLSDPYRTGLLIGGIYAASGAFNKGQHIKLAGDFDKPAFRLEIYASGRVSIAGMSVPFIWLVTRRPVFRFLIEHFQQSRKK
jgi:hypothetical protein